MFKYGEWTTKLDHYNSIFNNALPYEYCVIDNFFDDETFKSLSDNFPKVPEVKWDVYNNPIENKLVFRNFEEGSLYSTLVKKLNSVETINILKNISTITNLEEDPYLNGAGVHYHPHNTKLDLHLDYSIHPITGMERRLNLILFLNEEWRPEWGGALELWSDDSGKPKECITKIYPKRNSAVLFKTSDISIHGIPNEITCPKNIGRKTFAIYYVSTPREGVKCRKKANFFPLPNVHVSEKMKSLYEIRKIRRIEPEDLI